MTPRLGRGDQAAQEHRRIERILDDISRLDAMATPADWPTLDEMEERLDKLVFNHIRWRHGFGEVVWGLVFDDLEPLHQALHESEDERRGMETLLPDAPHGNMGA